MPTAHTLGSEGNFRELAVAHITRPGSLTLVPSLGGKHLCLLSRPASLIKISVLLHEPNAVGFHNFYQCRCDFTAQWTAKFIEKREKPNKDDFSFPKSEKGQQGLILVDGAHAPVNRFSSVCPARGNRLKKETESENKTEAIKKTKIKR